MIIMVLFIDHSHHKEKQMSPKRCPCCGSYSSLLEHYGNFYTAHKCNVCGKNFMADKEPEDEVLFEERKERSVPIQEGDLKDLHALLESTKTVDEFILSI